MISALRVSQPAMSCEGGGGGCSAAPARHQQYGEESLTVESVMQRMDAYVPRSATLPSATNSYARMNAATRRRRQKNMGTFTSWRPLQSGSQSSSGSEDPRGEQEPRAAHMRPAPTFKTPRMAIGAALSIKSPVSRGTLKGFPRKSRVKEQNASETTI